MPAFLSFFFFILPFQWALSPSDSVDLALVRILALGIAAVWLVFGLARRNITIPFRLVTFLWLSFLFLVTLSIVVAGNPSWGIRKILFLFSFAPLYFVCAYVLKKTPGAPKKVLWWLVIGSGITAVVAILQFFSQFIFGLDPVLTLWRSILLPFFLGGTFGQTVGQYPSLLVNISGYTLLRATAFFPDPHVAAYFFGLTIPSALLLAQKNPKGRLLRFVAATILIADLLTFSRGGYVGLLSGLLFWIVYSLRRRLFSKQAPRAILICFFLGLLFLFSPVGSRFLSSFSLDESSNQGRVAMWRAAGNAITAHPWLGVGIGNFPLFVQPDTDYRTPIYAHNLFLDVAAESGIGSSLLLILLLLSAIWSLVLLAQSDSLFLGPALGLIILSAHSVFDTPIFSVHILPILLLFLAMSTLGKSPPTQASL